MAENVQLYNHLSHVKFCTRDVNISLEETAQFQTVAVLALKLNANDILLLIQQSDHIFLQSFWIDVYFKFILF